MNAITSYRGPLIWETPTLGTMLRLLFQTPNVLLHATPTLVGLLLSTILWVRWRADFNWEQRSIDVLSISAITSFYAWTFDWVILLPSMLPALASVCQNPRRNWSWGCWCLAIQVLLVVQLIAQRNYVGTVWFPVALGLLYWLHKRKHPAPGTEVNSQPP